MVTHYLSPILLDSCEGQEEISESVQTALKETEARVISQVLASKTQLKEWTLTNSPRKGPLDKLSRDLLSAKEATKTKVSEEFTERLRLEQRKRKLRLKEQMTKRQQEEHSQNVEATKAKLQARLEREQQMKEKLEEAQRKRLEDKAKHTAILKSGRVHYREVLEQVPLFQRMEEKFHAVLARYGSQKRGSFRQVSPHAIPDFLRQLPRTNLARQTLEEDKAKENYVHKVREHRLRLLDRQKHYSVAVRTIFQPTPSPFKREERLSNISKLKQRPKPLQSARVLKHVPKVSLKKLKTRSQSNQAVPRSFRKIDYLPEVKAKFPPRRSIDHTNWQDLLENDSLSQERKAHRLRKIVESFDRKAVKAELQITGLHSYSKDRMRSMNKVSDLLIDSIKAKLSLLSHNSP